jgi:hypothetical protein
MDKLSDYLPLIIFIIAIVVSIAGGNKKKVTHETTIPGRKQVENRPDNRPVEKPRSKPKLSEKPVMQPATHTPFIPQQSKIKPEHEQQAFIIEVEEENSTPFLNLSDMDEVKKALIYTEVFKKKEY